MDRRSAKRVIANVGSFRNDPLYPRIMRAVAAILDEGKVVAPVDVLVRVGLLAPEQLDDWRRGRVVYLERVINSNLTRLSRLLRILQFHVHDLNFVPSVSVYVRWGKGPKQRLRFTKTGEPKLEEAYARHFVWPGKGPFHAPAPKERTAENDGRQPRPVAAQGRDTQRQDGTQRVRVDARRDRRGVEPGGSSTGRAQSTGTPSCESSDERSRRWSRRSAGATI